MTRIGRHVAKAGLAVLSLLIAACPATEPAGPDASVDAPPDSVPTSGLHIDWQSRPDQIPGEASSNARLDRAVFRTKDMRVIGDNLPGAIARRTLEWSAGVVPAAQYFGDALPGMYSRLLFTLDPGADVYAYELTGTVEVSNTTYPFTIRDRTATALTIDFLIALPPGGDAKIPVRVVINDLINTVDFSQVMPQGGRLIVEDGQSQIARVRDKLRDAFDVHDDDDNDDGGPNDNRGPGEH